MFCSKRISRRAGHLFYVGLPLMLLCIHGCESKPLPLTTLHSYLDENVVLENSRVWSDSLRLAFHVKHAWKIVGVASSDSTMTEWAWVATVSLDSISGLPRGVVPTYTHNSTNPPFASVRIEELRYEVVDRDGFILARDPLNDRSYPFYMGRYCTLKAPLDLAAGTSQEFRQMSTVPSHRAAGFIHGRVIVRVTDQAMTAESEARIEEMDSRERRFLALTRVAKTNQVFLSELEREKAISRAIQAILEEEKRTGVGSASRTP